MRRLPLAWSMLLTLSCLLSVLGCTEAPTASGSGKGKRLEVAEYTSDHYTVHIVGYNLTPQIQEKARETALLMERMFEVYASLEEMPLPPGEQMPLWLHLVRQEYDRQAAIYEFPPNVTTGFCNVDGEVHVYYRKTGNLSPIETVMHEGFHQYCHRAMHLPTPPEVYQRVPGYQRSKLPTVPLWLNEGMAMNMETATVTTDHNGWAVSIDNVGSVNKPRLEQLARLIRDQNCPSVRTIMNKIMGDQLTGDDYAVMWGLVFDLRIATGNAIYVREQAELERAGPGAVRAAVDAATDPARPYPYLRWPVPVVGRLLRACRVVWGLDVYSLVELAAADAREPRDFDRQWNRHVTQKALSEVEKLLRDQGQSLEQWEQGWRLRMLTLYGEVKAGSYQEEQELGRKKNSAARSAPRNVKQGVWK